MPMTTAPGTAKNRLAVNRMARTVNMSRKRFFDPEKSAMAPRIGEIIATTSMATNSA